ELREVEVADRVLDQPALVGAVERLADDLLRRRERQVGDLAADRLERALRLGLDLLADLLEPALPLALCLFLHPLLHRLARLPGLGEDLLGVSACLADQRAVLLEQPPRLVPGAVRLRERIRRALEEADGAR